MSNMHAVLSIYVHCTYLRKDLLKITRVERSMSSENSSICKILRYSVRTYSNSSIPAKNSGQNSPFSEAMCQCATIMSRRFEEERDSGLRWPLLPLVLTRDFLLKRNKKNYIVRQSQKTD